MSAVEGRLLLEDLEALKKLLFEVRPEHCCEGGIMVESGKGESHVCSDDCKWQQIYLKLATAMVSAELVVNNP